MASHPPAQCCTIGVKHSGDPTGSMTTIGDGIDAYIASPSGHNVHKDTAVLVLTDVIGVWQNSKLISDQFAANGYYTLMPDLFKGDPILLNRPAGFDLMTWLKQGSTGDNPHTWQYVDPIVEASIKELQSKGYKKIGAVGYCFGAKYVVRFLHKGKGVDVGYCAHPSFVEESELSPISGPFSIAAAETDSIFTVEKRHETEAILAKTGLPWQINLFSGVAHGFAVRADVTDKLAKFAKEQAFLQAVTWFDEHLLD